MLQLLITYIWFGIGIPQDYVIKLSQVDYPMQLLINPVFNTTLKLDIQKSDRYRLQYLRHGGIYSDMDNTINYTCLMKRLQSFDGEMAALQVNADGNIGNNFFYVPFNRTQLINQILDQNPQYTKVCETNVVGCNGPALFYKYRKRITVMNLSQCITHSGDWSWWKDSNTVQKAKRQPYKKLADKMIKKKYYVEKMEQYKKKNQVLERKVVDVQKKLKQAQKKIQDQTKIQKATNGVVYDTSLFQKFNQNLQSEKKLLLNQFNKSFSSVLKQLQAFRKQNSKIGESSSIFSESLRDEFLSEQQKKFTEEKNLLQQIFLHVNIFGSVLLVMLIIFFISVSIFSKNFKEKKTVTQQKTSHYEQIDSEKS